MLVNSWQKRQKCNANIHWKIAKGITKKEKEKKAKLHISSVLVLSLTVHM